MAERKRRSGIANDSENEKDQQSKDVGNEKNQFTRSGRLSKRRYLRSADDEGKFSKNVEGPTEAKTKKVSIASMSAKISREDEIGIGELSTRRYPEDLAFESPENVENPMKDEAVHTADSSDSTSQTLLVKAQKITSENSLSGSCSSSNVAKYGNNADTQNVTESFELAGSIPSDTPSLIISNEEIRDLSQAQQELEVVDKMEQKLMKFLAAKSEYAESPLNITQLATDFHSKNPGFQSFNRVINQIRSLRQKIPEMENFNLETKVRMLFALSASISKEYLAELRKDAKVEVDLKKRIKMYIKKDKTVQLTGDHSMSAKLKSTFEKEMRSSGSIPNISKKAKKNKDDREKIDDGIDTTAATAEILSESNCPDENAASDNDDHSKMISDSDDEDDVIYEGPGEPPLPAQLRKQEPVDYILYHEQAMIKREHKPHQSLLNTQQQHPDLEEIQFVDVKNFDSLSGFNEDFSTSGKDYLKSLRDLVNNLESPSLRALHLEIEETIKKLGTEDHKISTDSLVNTLNTGFLILNRNAKVTQPLEESSSLRDFFLNLQGSLSTFTSPSLETFKLEMKKTIENLKHQDKMITIDGIQIVLKYFRLLIVA